MALTYFRQPPRVQGHVHNRGVAGPYPAELEALLPRAMCDEALALIRGWPGYAPTPLREMDRLAATLGIRALYYKDENGRFGERSLKPLGVIYAAVRNLADMLGATPAEIQSGACAELLGRITLATASDGNTGRALAALSQQLGFRCRIYVHARVSEGRVRAITETGAEVVRVAGNYEAALERCMEEAEAEGWLMLSDVTGGARAGVPYHMMAGYSVMATEALAQAGERITHVVVPAASGGVAAGLAARFWMNMGAGRPRIVVVEWEHAACLLRSARRGFPARVKPRDTSVMTGLSCGQPSAEAWEVLRRSTADFLTVGDGSVAAALKMLRSGTAGGGSIEAGECAAPGPIALIGAASNPKLREEIGLDASSAVLLIGTEGATDPAIYRSLVAESE